MRSTATAGATCGASASLFRYTSRRVGLAMGAMSLSEILDEAGYNKLAMVPPNVAAAIEQHKLFGYR